jgi:hypothetical protein
MMNMKLLYVAVSILVFLSTTISDVDGILCLKKNNPEHIRLALQPNGVTISWTTSGYLGADDTPKPQVKYGTNQNALSNISPIGFTTTYNPLLIFKRFFHNVRLDGLQPSTKYYYRIEATKICVKESGIYSFITAPSTDNSAQQPINISIVGDLGLNNYFNQYQAEKTIAAMQQYISSSNFLCTLEISPMPICMESLLISIFMKIHGIDFKKPSNLLHLLCPIKYCLEIMKQHVFNIVMLYVPRF